MATKNKYGRDVAKCGAYKDSDIRNKNKEARRLRREKGFRKVEERDTAKTKKLKRLKYAIKEK